MKRIILLSLLAISLLALSSCHKPGNEDNPTPVESEITSENAAPGGFGDEGPSNWDE